jgi:hypothetical protein
MSTVDLEQEPQLDGFVTWLGALTADDFEAVAGKVRRSIDSADGELAWWKATVAVSGSLRRTHRSREAGLAAHRAVVAVQTAATRAGLGPTDRDAVTTVARAAAEVVRALVAEVGVAAIGGVADECDATRALLAPWTGRAVLAA